MPPPAGGPPEDASAAGDSYLFTYVVPFVGVLLVAVGIAAAVPGAYDLIQEEITECGTPTVDVESAQETTEQFDGEPPGSLARFELSDLSAAERRAVRAGLADPIGEARIRGEAPNYPAFVNGSLVTVDGTAHYVTVVAENPCFAAAPLQFPLGVFAIALGVVGILAPPAHRRLVALEEGDRSP
jgi:hypothetical protein